MRPGTIIRLSDGRIATVVYHGPDGYGAKLGRHDITEADIQGNGCQLLGVNQDVSEDYQWVPDVMLSGIEFEIMEGKSESD